MKIQFKNDHEDFKKHGVYEMSEADAQPFMALGVAHKVPDDTRLFVSPVLITDCVPTGQTLTLKELTGKK